MDRSHQFFDANGELVNTTYHNVTWEQVRSIRDSELSSSDWRAVKDRVLPTAWKEYRQALRDLPQNHDEANDAADAWPTPPE